MTPVVSIDVDGFSVAFDKASELASLRSFEAHAGTDIEGHHADVCLGMFEEVDPLDNAFVQAAEFLDAELIDVNHGDWVRCTI